MYYCFYCILSLSRQRLAPETSEGKNEKKKRKKSLADHHFFHILLKPTNVFDFRLFWRSRICSLIDGLDPVLIFMFSRPAKAFLHQHQQAVTGKPRLCLMLPPRELFSHRGGAVIEVEKRFHSVVFLQVSQRVCFEDKVFVEKNTRNRELCFEVAVFVQLRRVCAPVRLFSTERGGKSTSLV